MLSLGWPAAAAGPATPVIPAAMPESKAAITHAVTVFPIGPPDATSPCATHPFTAAWIVARRGPERLGTRAGTTVANAGHPRQRGARTTMEDCFDEGWRRDSHVGPVQ